MSKYYSRKFIVTILALASAITTAYTNIDPDVQTQLYNFLGTLLTFYLVAQGSVDTTAELRKPKPIIGA